MSEQVSLDQQCINTIRFLAADAVQKANSGHPGMPMWAAAIASALWTKHLKHNPEDPLCVDRDRFILSEGHWTLDVPFVVDAGATVLIAGSSIYNEKGSVAQNVAALR